MDLYLLIRRYVDFFKCVAPRGNIRMLLIYNYKMIIYWSIIKKCSQCFVTLPWFHREPLVVDFCIVWCPVQEYIAWMKDVALHKPSKVHFFCQRLVCTDVTPFFFLHRYGIQREKLETDVRIYTLSWISLSDDSHTSLKNLSVHFGILYNLITPLQSQRSTEL